ncbi:MAG: hypothetical protein HC855_01710 [Rhizobiales bacterium]|nr:hypothetical protein [Hyphomicrobiales bacterium]
MKSLLQLTVSAVFSINCVGNSNAATCKMDKAIYEIRGAAEFRLTLSKSTKPESLSNIAITVTTPFRSYDFFITYSNGYVRSFLSPEWPDAPDNATMLLLAFNEDLSAAYTDFKIGEPAPPLLLVPDLGPFIYYDSNHGSSVPDGFWRLQPC